MTAPAAPVIRAANVDGYTLRVMWRPVDDATDYNIYLGDTLHPTGLEDSVADGEAEPNGWFIWFSTVQTGQVFVRVTALNALAEESAYSNERSAAFQGAGENIQPTQALDHVRKL